MADNPFDAFDSPSPAAPAANPFDTFDAPQTRGVAQTVHDWFSKPTDELLPEQRSLSQAGTDVMNFSRAAANALGAGDQTIASVKSLYHDIAGDAVNPNGIDNVVNKVATGQGNANDALSNLAIEKDKTAQANEDLGPVGSLVANVVGSGPVVGGPVGGIGARITGKLAGDAPGLVRSVASRMTGQGVDSGVTSAAGAYGRGDDDAGKQTLMGTLIGAATGIPGGVAPRGVLPTIKTADQYGADATKAYADAGQIMFSHPQITQAADAAKNSISGLKPREIEGGKGASAVLDDMVATSQKYGGLDAEHLNDYMKGLHMSVTNDSVPDAGQAAQSQIKNLLQTAQPISAHAPGEALSVLNSANTSFSKAKDLNRIAGMETTAAQGGADVANQATSYINSPMGKKYSPPNSPSNAAFQQIGQQTAKPSNMSYYLKHYGLMPLAGIAGGEAATAVTGDENSPWVHGVSDLLGLIAMQAATRGYKGTTGAINKAEQIRNLNAAKATIGSGIVQKPVRSPTMMSTANNSIGDAIRQIYSHYAPARGAVPTN